MTLEILKSYKILVSSLAKLDVILLECNIDNKDFFHNKEIIQTSFKDSHSKHFKHVERI